MSAQPARARRRGGTRWPGPLLVALLAATGCARDSPAPRGAIRVVDALPWHDDGVWLQGDFHVHYLLTEERGRESLRVARDSGLDFVAAADHPEVVLRAGRREQLAAARRAFPELIVLAAVEWNVPAGDHASVMVEERPDAQDLLDEFIRRFDRRENPVIKDTRPDPEARTWGDLEDAVRGLEWLREAERQGRPRAVVYFNHLARKDLQTADDYRRLIAAGLSGVEASPGHQRIPDQPAVDRYDPFVAVIGAGYDQLSDAAHLGIGASSDFHIDKTAFRPGAFSRSLVHGPERSAAGVVLGLRRGATATVLGGVVRSVETRVQAEGSAAAALIGETLAVPPGARVRYRIAVDVARHDAFDRPNHLDEIEVVASWSGKAESVRTFGRIEPGETEVVYELPPEATAEPRRFFLRARGRRRIEPDGVPDPQGSDLLFYVAATHVEVRTD